MLGVDHCVLFSGFKHMI